MDFRATYSPEDNKLRLYASERLTPELYARVKGAGFIWAPNQKLFVAPMWTPCRADLLIDLCGDIGDEDTSLAERAADRADRFEEYSEKRAADADHAKNGVEAIAGQIPFGQPILVGHHSERRARKDAEKIENGMRKAVKMWECSQYWERRAAGAVHAAKYNELPGVRSRRIKGLEADKRREEKHIAKKASYVKAYTDPAIRTAVLKSGRSVIRTLLETYESGLSFEDQSALRSGGEVSEAAITGAIEKALSNLTRAISYAERWIAHIDNRLSYERAMLAASGYVAPVKAKKTLLPICNYRAKSITVADQWNRGKTVTYDQLEMTSEQYAKIHDDMKGTNVCENSHRVRVALIYDENHRRKTNCIFLTDSKVHEKPAAIEPAPLTAPRFPPRAEPAPYVAPEPTAFDAMKESLRAGVKTVSAPQLFPTPAALAEKAVSYADIRAGDRVLEPSAGTGALLEAIRFQSSNAVAVEINGALADGLRKRYSALDVRTLDFLSCNGDLGKFDRVVMNPPFENGADIKHINHALSMLKPGGKLVAICAAGPRQRAAFESVADHFEELPAGSFAAQGTNVNTALIVITKGDFELQ